MKPKVSVIVANYNNARYLRDCLQSIAEQSFADFECIVVDDGSTDGSAKIIRRFARRDQRFVPVFQENRGVSAARNRGLDMALGEYVAFLDSDDCFCPDAIGVMYNLAVGNHADIVGGGGARVMEDFELTTSVPANFANPPFRVFANSIAELKEMARLGGDYRFVWVWRRLFRRDCIGDVRFDEKLYPGEDTCFMLEVMPRAVRIVETTAMVVYHRISATAVSFAVFNQKYFAYIAPTMIRLRYIMDAMYPASFHKWFYRQYMDLVVQETIYRAMKTGRLMHQVADHLRPIYGTRVLPTKYLAWPKRLIFWMFMKVF